jgi:hypothetical protein
MKALSLPKHEKHLLKIFGGDCTLSSDETQFNSLTCGNQRTAVENELNGLSLNAVPEPNHHSFDTRRFADFIKFLPGNQFGTSGQCAEQMPVQTMLFIQNAIRAAVEPLQTRINTLETELYQLKTHVLNPK